MCGIAGTLRLGSDRPVTREEVARMCAVLRHRGPDDEGVHVDGGLGIGMRRLSIIDLATGRQPIGNEDGTVWTVFNGEIYNFRELRRELRGRGHVFTTATDTEVIVHLYEEHGPGFVERLRGMFALAVWDAPRRRLVLARDRLGIKPLYYAETAEGLLFGSELKAVLAGGLGRDVDRQALHDYLSLGYVPGPRTIFAAARKLPPAHLLVCERGQVTVRRYWALAYRPAPRWSDDEAAERLRALLRETVRGHLMSDVPLGVFLSGGVDSSTLVALMREVGGGPIRTFSIGFDEASYDELGVAREVARRFGTEHHELVVRPDAVDLVPALVRAFDEPFADSSAVPVYCVSRLARDHVKVVLSGEGGDEVFAGYDTYTAGRLAETYRRLPAALSRRLLPALVRRLPVSHRRVSLDYKAKRFVAGALRPPADAHYAWKEIFSEDAKAALYAGGAGAFAPPVRLYRDAFAACGAAEALTRLQHVDQAIYLPDDILVKADRMTMANSLEGRVPFVDHHVVEFAASLPARLRLRGLAKKYVLKRAMAGALPERVLRGPKRGFNVPIPVWLAGELRDLVHDVLNDKRVREAGFFDPAAVRALIDEHERRRHDRSRNLWALLVFTLWCEEYLPAGRAAAARAA
jgi:asparagine synthase (glutamine-hydrolysing)